MKIGLYTIHRVHNYGAMLQTYATIHALQNMGHEVEIVCIYSKETERRVLHRYFGGTLKEKLVNLYSLINPKLREKTSRFESFHAEMPLSKRFLSLAEYENNLPEYDVHLVGSDQVWNLEKGFREGSSGFLEFLPQNAKRISYAASFGSDKIDKKYDQELYRRLSLFNAISCREIEGTNLINSLGLVATQVMDPTFLPSNNHWCELAGSTPLVKGDYIVVYGLGENLQLSNIMLNQAKKMMGGIPAIGISVSANIPYDVDAFYKQAGPIEFLNLIRYAKFVVTASYHGAAFAIHFRKPFFVIKHMSRNARMDTMLSLLHLKKLMGAEEDITKIEPYSPIYTPEVIEAIQFHSTRSYKWLVKTLGAK